MAKTGDENLFLKHVEKLVLAVCVLVLAATVVLYPMAQPTVDLDKKEMGPDKVDAYLVKLIDDMGRRPPPPPPPTEQDYLALLNKLQDPLPLAPGLSDPRWVIKDVGVPRPWIRSEEEPEHGKYKLKLQDLVDLVPKPDKPLVGIASEYRDTDPPSEVVAAHATAIYPVAELLDRWQVAMKQSVLLAAVRIMDVRFERQEAQEIKADGTIVWGPSNPVAAVFRPAKDKEGNDVVVPDLPEVTEKNAKEVQSAVIDYFRNEWDKYKAEPDYWDVLGPQQQWLSWRINLPRTELTPKEETAPGVGPVHPPVNPVTPVTPPPPGPMPGPGPGPTGPTGRPPAGGGSPSPGVKPKPVIIRPTPVPAPGLVGGLRPVPIAVPVAAWNSQLTALGKVQVWVHDASLEYQKTYRYRAQLVLLSPVYGQMEEVIPPEDAKKEAVDTPWSDWSEPVKPPPQADVFLTGQQMKKVTMTVFSRCQGQRVSNSFDVGPGDRIGEKYHDKVVKTIDVDVPDLQNPGKTIKKPCSFFTGDTLIDIDWDRTVFLKGIAIKTVEVVLMDEQGNLVIHNLALDTASKEFKDLQAETTKVAPVVVPKPRPTTKPVRVPGPVRTPPH